MNESAATDCGTTLEGRVVLVTGASQGIGRAVALACAIAGATVVLHGRDERRLASVYDEIEAAGGAQPAAIPLDLATASDHQIAGMAGAIAESLGRLDGIVHNAALTERLVPVDAIDGESWLRLMRVNCVAPLQITRACLPLLSAAPDASVIYTLDSHAQEPGSFWGGVVVPRAALQAAMRIQAQEWSTQPRLRVNAIVPGPVASPSRRITHPGESNASLPAMAALPPAYLRLLGPAGRGISGQVVDALS